MQMRAFVDKELTPFCHEWDESGDYVPRSVFQKCGQVGILTAVCGAPWPSKWVPQGITPPGDIRPEEFDEFHAIIVKDELARAASGGVLWGLMGGHTVCVRVASYFESRLFHKVDCPSSRHSLWQ